MIVGINFVIARYGFCGNDVVNKVNVLDINLIIIKIKPTAVLKTTFERHKIAFNFFKNRFFRINNNGSYKTITLLFSLN